MKTFKWNQVPEKYLDRAAIEISHVNSSGETLCGRCERATRGKCPWAQKGKPYPGWTATKTVLGVQKESLADSYLVTDCPGFVATWEEVRIINRRGKAKDLLVRQIKQKPAEWQDEGVIALTNAMVKNAREEYILYKSHRANVSEWVRSAKYIDNPEKALADWSAAAKEFDKDPTQKERLLLGISKEEWDRRQEAKKKAKLRTRIIIYNTGTDLMFAECEQCGAEIDLSKNRPRWCPVCKLLVKEVVEA